MGRGLASKDFLAGILFVAFGLLGVWLARSLPAGTASAMEAGYFPRLVCGLLIAIGALLAIVSLFRASEPPERGRWRPIAFITLAALAFALLLKPLGLVLTLAINIILSRLAAPNVRAVPLMLLCGFLIAAVVGIFVFALKVVIPLWPSVF
jgi:putative tricarboxylic transport membrane protein